MQKLFLRSIVFTVPHYQTNKIQMTSIEQAVHSSFSLGQYVFFFLTTILAILTIYHFWFQTLRYVKLGNKLPGIVTTFPIIGDMYISIGRNNPYDIMNDALKIYAEFSRHSKEKLFRFWAGNRLGVVLLDPRDVELILGSQNHLEKSKEYDLFKPWLGNGLLISNGSKWRAHRKMIVPTFHQSILKTFVPIFNENAKRLVEKLRKEQGRTFDVHDYMCETTVNVLLETAMGMENRKGERSGFEYAKAVMGMCEILQLRQIKYWLRPEFIYRFTAMAKCQEKFLKIIHSLTDKVIKQRKAEYEVRQSTGETSLYSNVVEKLKEEAKGIKNDGINFVSGLEDDLDDNDESVGEKKRLAFLDFMIEASKMDENELSDEEIKDQVNTIMFEGHDTTAAGSSFVLCMLGVYQNIQDKVYEELKEIFQGSDRAVTFNDVLSMKYLERVMLETLRLYTPVPFITRIIREDIKLVSADYIIPKDTTVAIAPYQIHRDPDYFPNPLKFDPDNFLPERCQSRHYYSFIPFSAGPRSCVGRKYAMLKLKILLATILRNFKVVSDVEEKDFKLQADIILKRADGFKIRLLERNK